MGWNIYSMIILTKNHVAANGETDYYSRCKNLGGPADFWAGYRDGPMRHQYNAKNNSLVSSSKPFHVYCDFVLVR